VDKSLGGIESAQAFINNAAKELEQGALVFFAGDLNEPSYLDWQADTKDLFDHRGCIVNWGTSKLLVQRGYKDAYRVIHPDPVKCPGFTFPADNKSVIPENLSWTGGDERERGDFVYYYQIKSQVKGTQMVGQHLCADKE
ncbi:MAG: endonuclease, partial [Bacteroides xylanisolvens]